MITIANLKFLEDEKIDINSILTCHPQGISVERIGVPLRVTVGYQCFYDKRLRTFQGITFYAPGGKTHEDPPRPQFSYVLASMDGDIKIVNGELCLIATGKTIIYSHLKHLKTSGKVKKGQIIGEVQGIPDGIGYGVSIRGYKGGNLWDIEKEIFNIPCTE